MSYPKPLELRGCVDSSKLFGPILPSWTLTKPLKSSHTYTRTDRSSKPSGLRWSPWVPTPVSAVQRACLGGPGKCGQGCREREGTVGQGHGLRLSILESKLASIAGTLVNSAQLFITKN